MADLKYNNPDSLNGSAEEIIITENGDWTVEEETRAKRK